MRTFGNVVHVCLYTLLSAAAHQAAATTLEVGPSHQYARIEDAYNNASAGDTILVHPLEGDSAYRQVALLLRKEALTILGAGSRRVRLDGDGYEYSGAGSVPRAMFQFNPGSDGSTVARFEIYNCSNSSNNGAAFRINQTNGITIRDCHIHGNDMGIMSNGVLDDSSSADQLIEDCLIHDNGDFDHAGYNHNLYLGGTSVTIRGCDIHSALTGHNIKSRAHRTIVEGCFVHDSPNRELDLVDGAGETDVPGSHALVSGCIIRKHPDCTGNKTVIHFGQDGSADHNGTIYLLHCTILTPYRSPVIDLSSLNAGAMLRNCLIVDPSGTAAGQTLVNASRNGASLDNAGGHHLWVSHGFASPGYGSFTSVTTGDEGMVPGFIDESTVDYRPDAVYAGIVDAAAQLHDGDLPPSLRGRVLLTFGPPLGSTLRTFVGAPDIGACERGTDMTVRPPSPARARSGAMPATLLEVTLSGRAGIGQAPGALRTCVSGVYVSPGRTLQVLK